LLDEERSAKRGTIEENEMIKSLFVASLMALALTACNKSNDGAPAAAGGATPPAGLSQLGGHTGPNSPSK